MVEVEKEFQRAPEGIDVNWVVQSTTWPISTWIEKQLFVDEFLHGAVDYFNGKTFNSVCDMLQALQDKVGRAMSTTDADRPVIQFKFWRKLNERARKAKSIELKASLFKHPEYNRFWMYVEYAS